MNRNLKHLFYFQIMELPNQAIKLEFNVSDIKIEPESNADEANDPLALHEHEKYFEDDETEYPAKKKPKKSMSKVIIQSQKSIVVHDSDFRNDKVKESGKVSIVGEIPFKCDICGKCLSSKINLEKHMSAHYKIHIKPKVIIQSQKSVVIHDSDPRNDKVKKSGKVSIVIHNTDNVKRPRHVCVCNVCGREFRDNYNYQRHLKTHTNEKTSKCVVCAKQFSELQKLKYHWFTHTAEKIWQCGGCPSGNYMSRQGLLKHCSVMHPDIQNVEDLIIKNEFDSTAMTCKECFEVINGFPALIQHYNSQHPELEETVFVNHNDGGAGLKSNLERFMVTNRKEKLFQCDLCLKTFADKKNVEPHLYSHTGERLFGCDICSFSVDTLMKLKYHYEKRHPSESFPKDKQFIKSFYTKVFLCPFCSVQVNGLIETLEHFKGHHLNDLRSKDQEEKATIKCDFCDCSYSTKGALTRHMKSKHVDQAFEKSSQDIEWATNDSNSQSFHYHPEAINDTETMENTESFQSDCANSNDLNLPSESNKQINSDERPTNQCLFCGQGYKKLPSLTSHLRNCEFAKSNCEGSEGPTAFEDSTSSGIGLLPNQCVFCKQSFEELHLLITHLRTCDQAKGS